MEAAATKKPWYKSKTKWAGILIGLAQLCKLFPPAAPAVIVLEAIGAGLGGVGIRDAITDSANGK